MEQTASAELVVPTQPLKSSIAISGRLNLIYPLPRILVALEVFDLLLVLLCLLSVLDQTEDEHSRSQDSSRKVP